MSLVRFTLRRVGFAAGTVVVASFAVFAAMFIAPTSEMSLLTGGRNATPQQVAAIKAEYHLNEGLFAQYWHWATQILHGHLGYSFLYHEAVGDLLSQRIVTTLYLVGYAATLILIFGIGLGALAALRGRTVDSILRVLFSFGIAMPSFVMGSVLITLFAVTWRVFPSFGAGSGFPSRISHLTLPAIALAVSNISYVAKITRSSVIATKDCDFVWAARIRGLRERSITSQHVMRNGLLPVITVSGLTIAGLLAGAVVIENVFSLNGIGSLLVNAISQKDFATAQVVALLLIVVFVVMSTAVDILYGVVDPRVIVDA